MSARYGFDNPIKVIIDKYIDITERIFYSIKKFGIETLYNIDAEEYQRFLEIVVIPFSVFLYKNENGYLVISKTLDCVIFQYINGSYKGYLSFGDLDCIMFLTSEFVVKQNCYEILEINRK